MPLHPVALELLQATGPLAVSSANRSGFAPAATALEARRQLGDAVAVYLDAGPVPDPIASTILDLSGDVPVVRRVGAVSVEALREVVTAMQAKGFTVEVIAGVLNLPAHPQSPAPRTAATRHRPPPPSRPGTSRTA